MAPSLRPRKIPFGAANLLQDMATLINNRQGSDVQFRVGGGTSTQGNAETIYDESAAVTLYAHSLILRCRSSYFVDMLDKNNDWKENSKCVIYKPSISSSTFQDVLHYIYTGDVRAKNSDNIIELIAVADEMGLEELGTECQAEYIRRIKFIFSDKNEGSTRKYIPFDVALRIYIIPGLNLANGHSLSNLSQELLTIMLPHMPRIIEPDTYTEFVDKISSEALVKIIASDDLAMTERSVWDLALSWACHQTKLSKTAVEARLNNPDDKEDGVGSSDGTLISDTQLNQLKKIMEPLLPVIRFSLLNPEDYTYMVNILIRFLSQRRFTEITRFFVNPDGKGLLDAPRKKANIVVEYTTWNLLRKSIFETGGITGCLSSNYLKFKLLFRASEHGFLASIFHQRCDNKGPTLVIVKSSDGHLFGGVNFNHWKSDNHYSSSALNFLFALPDKHHRNVYAVFRIKDQTSAKYSSKNPFSWGPCFGAGSDLAIANSANTNQVSFSRLPYSYDGIGASDTALAGSHNFAVSDYEVFAISRLHMQ